MNKSPQLQLQVSNPCPKKWAEMHGDDKKRYCTHCNLHVHNLSAMSDMERQHFAQNLEKSGKGACITYKTSSNGALVTESLWSRFLRPFKAIQFPATGFIAFMISMLFTGCLSRRTLGKYKHKFDPLPEQSINETTGFVVKIPHKTSKASCSDSKEVKNYNRSDLPPSR